MLSDNAKHNRVYYDDNGEEYRYAFVNVGEGYYLLYQIDVDAVYVLDCLHKREFKEMIQCEINQETGNYKIVSIERKD